MIKVSVFYANTPGSHFDHGYYCKTHMPMVARLMGGCLKSYSVDKGIAGGAAGQPGDVHRGGTPACESVEAFQAGFRPSRRRDPRRHPGNYTDLSPIIRSVKY